MDDERQFAREMRIASQSPIYANDITVPTDESQATVHFAARRLEGVVATWAAMWVTRELSDKDLWSYYSSSFMPQVQRSSQYIRHHTLVDDDIIRERVETVCDFLLQLGSDAHCARRDASYDIVASLLAAMLFRQYTQRASRGAIEGFSFPFAASTGGVARQFLDRCLETSRFRTLITICAREPGGRRKLLFELAKNQSSSETSAR